VICIPTFSQNVLDTVFVKCNNSWTDKIDYKTDTIYFHSSMRRNMIFGTTVWPSSSNQFNAYWNNGIRFDKVESSNCIGQVEEFDMLKTGITKVITKDSVWIIKALISDNCCYSFICDIKVVNKNILELDYYGYGSNHCDCDCFFELTYSLSRKDFDKSKNIEYVRIFENNKTMKKINKP
jgi:hypothetical protein